ncbi:hypothetical protein ACH44C_30480 [Streptomyces purpureus]|uniref:hypothetical protein n=1 Tax=Streptomyces purpureus TaxID=1951 RepID=UPI0037A1A03C
MVAVALATGLALAVSGCGDEGDATKDKPAASASNPKGSGNGKQPQTEAPTETLAVLKGQGGLELTVQSAKRDAGGFLTVTGKLSNTSDASVAVPAQVSGNETEIIKHGTSLGGATLVDSTGKKRYYTLRDTDGRPLTTSGLGLIAQGASTNVFMQFPAPPASTSEVSLQLPTFSPGTIKLS